MYVNVNELFYGIIQIERAPNHVVWEKKCAVIAEKKKKKKRLHALGGLVPTPHKCVSSLAPQQQHLFIPPPMHLCFPSYPHYLSLSLSFLNLWANNYISESSLLCRRKMAFWGLLFVSILSLGSCVHAYGGGWMNAHATFYGGGDASGTMGISHFPI